MELIADQAETVRAVIADILEIEPAELSDEGLFIEEYDADSLRAVEILATLEKKFRVKIPESELKNMVNLRSVLEVLARHGA